jgi:hypothetical protein
LNCQWNSLFDFAGDGLIIGPMLTCHILIQKWEGVGWGGGDGEDVEGDGDGDGDVEGRGRRVEGRTRDRSVDIARREGYKEGKDGKQQVPQQPPNTHQNS